MWEGELTKSRDSVCWCWIRANICTQTTNVRFRGDSSLLSILLSARLPIRSTQNYSLLQWLNVDYATGDERHACPALVMTARCFRCESVPATLSIGSTSCRHRPADELEAFSLERLAVAGPGRVAEGSAVRWLLATVHLLCSMARSHRPKSPWWLNPAPWLSALLGVKTLPQGHQHQRATFAPHSAAQKSISRSAPRVPTQPPRPARPPPQLHRPSAHTLLCVVFAISGTFFNKI